MMIVCPECGGSLIKKGFDNDRQRYKCKNCGHRTVNPKMFQSDKKKGITDWREWSKNCIERQELKEKASNSQDRCDIFVKTDNDYIIYQPLSDIHVGAIGCDYARLVDFTDSILKRDDLFFSVSGDMADKFSRFKNMLAVHQMDLSPEDQDKFIESWVQETAHKFLFSTWGNHEEMEESASGQNAVKNILNKKVVYFNGIGVANVHVNDIKYKVVTTHKTRFNSAFNKTHGLKQLARKEIPDADIYVSGHTHDPSFEYTVERGIWQLFVVLSSFKYNDGYAKRYFTYHISTQMTAIVLSAKDKKVIPFENLELAFRFIDGDIMTWKKYLLI